MKNLSKTMLKDGTEYEVNVKDKKSGTSLEI